MGKTDEERLMWLDALECAGVDNWDGIDEAARIYYAWIKDNEQEEDNV